MACWAKPNYGELLLTTSPVLLSPRLLTLSFPLLLSLSSLLFFFASLPTNNCFSHPNKPLALAPDCFSDRSSRVYFLLPFLLSSWPGGFLSSSSFLFSPSLLSLLSSISNSHFIPIALFNFSDSFPRLFLSVLLVVSLSAFPPFTYPSQWRKKGRR